MFKFRDVIYAENNFRKKLFIHNYVRNRKYDGIIGNIF